MIQCILAFLICFTCQLQAQKGSKDEIYTLAISYEKSGDAKNAARLFQELYAKDNTNSDYLYVFLEHYKVCNDFQNYFQY